MLAHVGRRRQPIERTGAMGHCSTYGYVRVSTVEQNVERQVAKMRELGIEGDALFVDKASGKDMDRPMWRELSARLEEGDTLVIDSLDRLGRDYDDVTEEWRRLTRDVGVRIRCLDLDFFDSAKFSEMGDLGICLEDMLLSLLAYVAQTERKKMRQRQAEGIAVAKAAGKYTGRKPTDVDESLLAELVDMESRGEVSAREAARRLGVSDRTYRRRRDALVA